VDVRGRGILAEEESERSRRKSIYTVFVEPPRMFTFAMAFRNEFRVRMSLWWK
jgi:hypothetical protein